MPLPPRRSLNNENAAPAQTQNRVPSTVSASNNASKFGYQRRSLSDIDTKIIESSSSYKSYFIQKYKEFKPKEGENHIRILPPLGFNFPKHVTPHYGITLYMHFLMTSPKATIICPNKSTDFRPSSIESKCPVCEDVSRLYATNQAEKVKTLRIKAQKKTLVWMLDLKNPSENTPLLFAIPSTLDLGFIKLCKDRSTGEIYNLDDPDAGFNIFFDKTKELGGTKYIGEFRDSRPTSVSPEHLQFVHDNPLPNLLMWRGYEELKSLYGGEIPSTIGDDEDDRNVRRDDGITTFEDNLSPDEDSDDILNHYQ